MDRIQHCFTRALNSYDRHVVAQQRICQKLAYLLPLYAGTHFGNILEIGCGTGNLTGCLLETCHIGKWILNDLCKGCFDKIKNLFPDDPPLFIAGDAESIPFSGPFDLIASASVFQWILEPEIFLHKLAGLLQPGGVLLFSTFSPGNLYEIKRVTGKGLLYPPPDKWRQWLSADFRILHQEDETLLFPFSTPLDVLKHLKSTGVTATGNEFWTRGKLEQFCLQYLKLFHNQNNQVTLTYRPLYFLAVKK